MPITQTPLRYPGGKSQLRTYISALLEVNGLIGGSYVEPYAGGAGLAMSLLLGGMVSRIEINDKDLRIYAFWHCVFEDTESLVRKIYDTPVTVSQWEDERVILSHPEEYDLLSLAFATFFINRTSRSGILKGGIIGGKEQQSKYKIDCRYNKSALISLIEHIADFKDRVYISNQDAIAFLHNRSFSPTTLIYADPPYFEKGKALYMDYYSAQDHVAFSEFIHTHIKAPWIVSYDNVPDILAMYSFARHRGLRINYSVAKKQKATEVMFFSDSLIIPDEMSKKNVHVRITDEFV